MGADRREDESDARQTGAANDVRSKTPINVRSDISQIHARLSWPLRDEDRIVLHVHIEFGQSFHAANYSAPNNAPVLSHHQDKIYSQAQPDHAQPVHDLRATFAGAANSAGCNYRE